MRTHLRWRYYCDFCNKVGGSRVAMVRHEAACFSNPERVCPLCDDDQLAQHTMPELLAALNESFAALTALTEGCPACITSALRQNPLAYIDSRTFDFDYRTAVTAWAHDGRGKYNEDNHARG